LLPPIFGDTGTCLLRFCVEEDGVVAPEPALKTG